MAHISPVALVVGIGVFLVLFVVILAANSMSGDISCHEDGDPFHQAILSGTADADEGKKQ